MVQQEHTHANIKHWTEYRTESGRWSKIKHDMEKLEFDSLQLRYFFDWEPKGQRITRTYFREGLSALACDRAVPGWNYAPRISVQLQD